MKRRGGELWCQGMVSLVMKWVPGVLCWDAMVCLGVKMWFDVARLRTEWPNIPHRGEGDRREGNDT